MDVRCIVEDAEAVRETHHSLNGDQSDRSDACFSRKGSDLYGTGSQSNAALAVDHNREWYLTICLQYDK